ncbi:hypothetical protein BD410DRAFT_605281 [Rickenella mellea]|uniref:Uncharacterized protein n=1 Tax=Rickenella mellea TaxID=50990 RepID=A0A4Y7QDM6_9AGAM|nr:hypothetical protein BD410DRAFT_605281 [Rickenella mellea]
MQCSGNKGSSKLKATTVKIVLGSIPGVAKGERECVTASSPTCLVFSLMPPESAEELLIPTAGIIGNAFEYATPYWVHISTLRIFAMAIQHQRSTAFDGPGSHTAQPERISFHSLDFEYQNPVTSRSDLRANDMYAELQFPTAQSRKRRRKMGDYSTDRGNTHVKSPRLRRYRLTSSLMIVVFEHPQSKLLKADLITEGA